MRILLFCSSYAPRTGGVETVTRRLARKLTNAGHEVTVATNRYPRNLPTHESIDGIHVFRQLYPDVLPSARRGSLRSWCIRLILLPMAPIALLRLLALVWRLKPDIINIHYFSHPAIYALLVGRVLGVPVLLSCHGADVGRERYPAFYARALRMAVRLPSAFTACSEYLAQQLLRFLGPRGKDMLVVAYNGVEIEPITLELRPTLPPYALIAARLEDVKGIDVAIWALALLSRSTELSLVVAGAGSRRHALVELARTLDLEGRVVFLGQVDHASVGALLQSALMVLAPSREEAFGMSCLEAMLAGKPLVASRVGGIPEITDGDESAILVPPDDPAALADGIAFVLAHPTESRDLGERGHRRALASFTWSQAMESYLRAYALAMGRAARPVKIAEGAEAASHAGR